MTDPHRGAYTPPTDAPLSFDARRPTLTHRRPIPVTLILSALVLAAMIGAVFFFYRSGVRGADDAPQPVGTPIGEIMAPAPAENRPADPAAGLEIYKTDELAEGAPTFAPPPEQPKARPTTPVETAAIPPLKITKGAAPSENKQVVILDPQPKATTPQPKATLPATPIKPVTGASAVQIGAFSSQSLADKGWNDALAVAGGSGLGKSVTAVQSNGATLYRTTVTGFASRDAAAAFCDRLKAAG
ncbi:MAG TPA: SPOR domain-containing protein, partial [Caulobacteraceae bacterium]|nr:SPOR domain-containing protein [Caulobacteraceae bacterium]